MKYLITLCSFVLISLVQNAQAGKIDSVYADLCIPFGNNGVPAKDSAAMFGAPDGVYGKITGNETLIDIAFRKPDHKNLQSIKNGSTILVWGKKDLSVDSSAGQIVFYKTDAGGAILSQSQPYYLGDGVNVVPVQGDDYTYVELSLALPTTSSTKFATSYLIDAVALVQDTATPTKNVASQFSQINALASYPNPFVANTTIHFELQTEGSAELVIVDMLGKEVDRINAGYEQNGVHEIPLAIKNAGLYFVRLFVNGQPVGYPLKINSR